VPFAFDHAVVIVDVLADATRAFATAGFTVTPGGRHDALPTENALICFGDGSYLELLALRDDEARESLKLRHSRPGWERDLKSGPAIGRRFLPRLARGAGVADFVLVGERLARFAAESRRRGFEMTGPAPMSRERADGTRLAWQLLLPAADHLPFLIEDATPRDLRVPGGPARTHANGARGVATVRVRVASVATVALEYADLFGVTPRVAADGTTTVPLPGAHVVLEPGEPIGACAVTLSGVTSVGPAIAGLGITAAGA
jgi:hypothetical protein